MGPAFVKLALASGGPGGAGDALSGSLGAVMDSAGVSNKWLKQLLDLECFVISGCLAGGTPSPEMGFMYKERHRPGAILDFPIGGSQAFIDAMVRGIQKRGGRVLLGAPVEEIVMEGGRAAGVKLAGGKGIVRGGLGVVCSTSIWDRLVRSRKKLEGAESADESALLAPLFRVCFSLSHFDGLVFIRRTSFRRQCRRRLSARSPPQRRSAGRSSTCTSALTRRGSTFLQSVRKAAAAGCSHCLRGREPQCDGSCGL